MEYQDKITDLRLTYEALNDNEQEDFIRLLATEFLDVKQKIKIEFVKQSPYPKVDPKKTIDYKRSV